MPAKIQEFALLLLHACALSEKFKKLFCASAFNSKKEHLFHIHCSVLNSSRFENLNFSK
jgi:hypothetical protein